MKILMRRFIASLLVVTMAGMAIPQHVSAGMIATEAVAAGAERDRVAAMLARADVRAQLESLGVRPSEVQARMDALSDEEVAQLAGRLDGLPAGGDGIVGAIVLVFLILLLTDLLGWTKVFPFTRQVVK
ncbi:MAG: PA2779 family protein [Burkholderiales bacterium]